MFPYPPEHEHIITPTKALFLALLCAVWVGTGLVGHDPWKPEDAHSFGLIFHILQSGDWLVPNLAGDAYMDKPPLYYLTAALFAKLFSPWLALHDGARLASGFYTTLTLLFIGLTGRELFGSGRGWAAVIILIGCLGMLVTAHQMVTDLALFTGLAIMQYGYSLSHRRPQRAGILLGTGLGIGFMAKGFIAPMLFLLISLAMLIYRNWRVQPYYTALGRAVLWALPWLTLWPVLLYLHSPQLFAEWAWTHNIGRWFEFARGGDFADAFYYVRILPWFAWPALPLAAWAVWQARKKVFHTIEFQLPLTSFIVMLVTLSFVPNIKDIFALPMLLPLTLLATAALSTLRRGAANALDWFGIMTFGLLAIFMWWGWTGLLLDNHAKITQLLKEYQPGFQPSVHTPTFWLAVLVTFLWVVLAWRVGRSMRRAVVNWAAGVTLVWVLAMTIWLPWLNSGKSYRSVAAGLQHALPAQHGCIASKNVGATQRAMLQYHGNLDTQQNAEQNCDWLLTQGRNTADPAEDTTLWKKVWEGGRPSDKDERFRLYQKVL
ncbi:MAG: glycosyltransferase family 39 protein [Nitrosomonadales bacterium]|nr:glycosyltransferase family 39 protein [Nitrosomonadales bacterium]